MSRPLTAPPIQDLHLSHSLTLNANVDSNILGILSKINVCPTVILILQIEFILIMICSASVRLGLSGIVAIKCVCWIVKIFLSRQDNGYLGRVVSALRLIYGILRLLSVTPNANSNLFRQATLLMELVNALLEYPTGIRTKEYVKETAQSLLAANTLGLMKMENVSVKDKIYG